MVMSGVNPLTKSNSEGGKRSARATRKTGASASPGSARNLAVDRGLHAYGRAGSAGKNRGTRSQQAQAKAQAGRAERDGAKNPMHGGRGGSPGSSLELGVKKESFLGRMKKVGSINFFGSHHLPKKESGAQIPRIQSDVQDSSSIPSTIAEEGSAGAAAAAAAAGLPRVTTAVALARTGSHRSFDLAESTGSGLVQGGLPTLGDERRASRLATSGAGVVLHSAQSAKSMIGRKTTGRKSLVDHLARNSESIGEGIEGITEVNESGAADDEHHETMQL